MSHERGALPAPSTGAALSATTLSHGAAATHPIRLNARPDSRRG
jgi:hypothetical protein